MKKEKFICCICGKQESPTHWVDECGNELMEHQMCFECNHWRKQHELDITERGEHGYAIVNGGHYVLEKSAPNNYFKGFGGHKFKFEFLDGTTVECDNVWFQGEVTKAHPHWREVMKDNAVIRQ